MGKKKNKKGTGDSLVYTTNESGNPFFNSLLLNDEDDGVETDKSSMIVRVQRDRKNRGGKEVSLITGLELEDSELLTLAKLLKSKCGVGGAAKDSEIIIQGNHVDKIIELLKKEGYKNTKRTGG